MPIIKKQAAAPPTPDERRRQPRDLDGLLTQLESDDPVSRRWATRDLGAHPQASAALVSRLGRETDRAVRESILSTLSHFADDVAVQGLVTCLRSEDVAVRNEAIEALKEMEGAVAPALGALLESADPDLRIYAVDVLGSLRHPDVESWLLDVIDRDSHVNVCATAVNLLAEVGTPLSREPLVRLKARFPDEPYILFAADLALERLGDP